MFENQEYEQCMDLVVEHFRTRKSPTYLFTREDMKEFQDDHILDEAQEVLDHKIYGYQFPGDIDWTFNPTGETSRIMNGAGLYIVIFTGSLWQELMF